MVIRVKVTQVILLLSGLLIFKVFQRLLLSLVISGFHSTVILFDPIFCLSQMVTWIFLFSKRIFSNSN